MTENDAPRGAHRAQPLPDNDPRGGRGTASAPGLVTAAVLGVCCMLAVVAVVGAAGSQATPPPSTAPRADGPLTQGSDVGPPEIEFTMTAWPTESGVPAPPTMNAPVSPAPPAQVPASPGQPPPAQPPPAQPPPGQPAPPSPAPPPVTYTDLAGYGCPNSATHTFTEVGRYTDGQSGWYAVASGGWTGDGCNGRFDAMEMSGYATVDDPDAYALWSFSVGSGSKQCQISVYVPTSSNSRDAAGKPAQYYVLDTETGPVRASFTIDQRYNHGRWINGTYTANGSKVVIKLVSRGEDWDDTGLTHEHIAVAQVRLTCTG